MGHILILFFNVGIAQTANYKLLIAKNFNFHDYWHIYRNKNEGDIQCDNANVSDEKKKTSISVSGELIKFDNIHDRLLKLDQNK